jgi:hypothetical protein
LGPHPSLFADDVIRNQILTYLREISNKNMTLI